MGRQTEPVHAGSGTYRLSGDTATTPRRILRRLHRVLDEDCGCLALSGGEPTIAGKDAQPGRSGGRRASESTSRLCTVRSSSVSEAQLMSGHLGYRVCILPKLTQRRARQRIPAITAVTQLDCERLRRHASALNDLRHERSTHANRVGQLAYRQQSVRDDLFTLNELHAAKMIELCEPRMTAGTSPRAPASPRTRRRTTVLPRKHCSSIRTPSSFVDAAMTEDGTLVWRRKASGSTTSSSPRARERRREGRHPHRRPGRAPAVEPGQRRLRTRSTSGAAVSRPRPCAPTT